MLYLNFKFILPKNEYLDYDFNPKYLGILFHPHECCQKFRELHLQNDGYFGPISKIWVNATFLVFGLNELNLALNQPKIEYSFLGDLGNLVKVE